MNILLTNDDGYDQYGLILLKEFLKKYGTVYVCAPHYHQSGASMSFSIGRGFKVYKHDDFTYSIDGSPADVVILGLQIIPVKFDLVVSGCNDGHNISYDSLYSGTIGAAVEALNHQIPSIAFSTDFGGWEVAKNELEATLKYVFDNKLYSNKYLLNINFPRKPYTKSLGIKITRETFKKDRYYYEIREGLYFTDRYESFEVEDQESDVYAIDHGYTSICPLGNSLYSAKAYEELIKNGSK